LLGLFCSLLLAGCAIGEAGRWINPERKTASVEGVAYDVFWVRDATGIDMRGVRSAIVFMPDELIERRRNTEAALIIGRELCGGNALVVSETKDSFYYTRIRCG
jgi:hypothetical protein